MRYLFCYCAKYKCAEDKYESRRASSEVIRRWDRAGDERDKIEKQFNLPGVLYILEFICIFIFGLAFVTLIDLISHHIYTKKSLVVWISAGLALLILAGIKILEIKTEQRKNNSREYQSAKRKEEQAIERIREYMEVPEENVQIDILHFNYSEYKGKLKKISNASLYNYYFFNEGRELKIYNGLDYMYSIPYSDIKSIKLVDKKIDSIFWGDTKPKGRKSFGIRGISDNVIDYFCVLELEHKGETFYLPFLTYDLPAMLKLTGLEPKDPDVSYILDRINTYMKTYPE